MAGMDFFIRPATGTSSSDWVRIGNADIKVRMTRRLTRTVVRGQEGDDLHDEGSESTLYTVRGELTLDEYKRSWPCSEPGSPTFTIPSKSET